MELNQLQLGLEIVGIGKSLCAERIHSWAQCVTDLKPLIHDHVYHWVPKMHRAADSQQQRKLSR